MKIKKLVYILVAVAAVACSKNSTEEPLTVTPTDCKVGTKDTVLTIKVQSAEKYRVTADAESVTWIAVSDSGEITAESFTIAVKANKFAPRTASVTVSNSQSSKTVTIQQSGSGRAPSEAPYKAGYNVRGVVTDSNGYALPDVVVSDGYQCTKTDDNGCYYLKTDQAMSMTVFPICPAEYDRNYDPTSGLWSDWKAIDYTNSKFSANFSLKTKKGDINNCRMILLGDPQRINHREHSKVAWTEFCKDLNQYKNTVSQPLYQIIMGDMVTDEMEVDEYAKAFIETLGTSGLRTNTLVGNHDHVTDAKNYYDSVKDYVKHFGPYNYAFNIAGFHVIVLDSVSWKNEDWDTGFNTEAATFLKNDMAFVPAGVPIIICTHCPITKKFGGTIPSNSSIENFATYRAQMKGRDVYMFYGHSHITAFWKYTDSELSSYATGLKSLSSCTVGRCNGAWSCSGEICRDGVPWGVVELDLNGSDIKWQFKSFEPDKYLDNINVYLPGQFKGEDIDSKRDDTMYCNVYVWDNSWSTPELWSDGKKVSSFYKCRYFKNTSYDSWADMLHEHFYNIWKVSDIPGFRPDSGQEPYDNCHLFKLVPPAGVTSGTVKVTDRWGRVYSKDVTW